MAGIPVEQPKTAPGQPTAEPAKREAGLTVEAVLTAFLADAAGRLKAPTMRLYRLHLTAFAEGHGKTIVNSITAGQISRWLAQLPHSSTTKAMMLRSVSACFGWAVVGGLMTANPAKSVPKPKSRSRSSSAVITAEQHAKMMAVASPTARPLLAVLHATGCRPGEACRITAESFNAEAGVIILHEHKADRAGKPRVVFLPPEIVSLLKPLAERYPTGPLLRTVKGNPWDAQSVNLAVRKIAKRCGFQAIPYGYRHGFATEALASGVSDAQVAALLGHTSTAMLHKHYSHLTSQATAMREALSRVRSK